MKSIRGSFFLLLVGSAALSPLVAAQPGNAGNRFVESAVQSTQTNQLRKQVTSSALGPSTQTIPELYPGENADVGPQYLLMPKAAKPQRRTWFEAGADLQYFYTSNTFLTEKGNIDTGLLISTIYAGLAPTFDIEGKPLTLRLGYRHQRYNYGLDDTSNQLNNFDFDVGTVYLNGRYQFAENWTATVGIDYNRYLSAEESYNEFYTEAQPAWGLERRFPINDNNAITIAYYGASHFTFTDPQPVSNINDRLDTVFLLTSSHQILPHLVLQPFYRFQQTHYWQNSDRNDAFNTLGISVTYYFREWASIRAFTSYEVRDSNDPMVPDYEKYDTGGGVSVAFKF